MFGKLVMASFFLAVIFVISSCCCSRNLESSQYSDFGYLSASVLVKTNSKNKVGLLTLNHSNISLDLAMDQIVYAVHAQFDTTYAEESTVYINMVSFEGVMIVNDVLAVKPEVDLMRYKTIPVTGLPIAYLPSESELKDDFGDYLMDYHSAFAELEDHDETNHKRGHVNTWSPNYNNSGLDYITFPLATSNDTMHYYSSINMQEYFNTKEEIYVETKNVIFKGMLDSVKLVVDIIDHDHFPHRH